MKNIAINNGSNNGSTGKAGRERRIYTIATAHLDTVWNWDLEYVISVCLKNTLDDNFALFEKYPGYEFNFEGAYRYELIEEYYPDKFEKLKEYVAAGRWNPCGSCYENGDVNIPSPESLFRNILYGNNYFQEKFGKKSNDLFLPDCFGFGYALPSVANHANLKGITTQKLSWGGAYPLPFDTGIWTGPDGKGIFASPDARSYCTIFSEVRTKKELLEKLKSNLRHNLAWTLSYHGVGDTGGAPKEESVGTVCRESAANDSSDIKVLITSPSRFFDDLSKRSDEENALLPIWNNELVMTDHGVGAYTSRSFSKRCNRRNEELADMAERAAVMAMCLTDAAYPRENIERAWKKTIAHTFHDDITGTSIQKVYMRSWNDYILSAGLFCSVYEGAAAEVIQNIDTSRVKGTAIVINNMLEQERTGIVDVVLPYAGTKYMRIFSPDGEELPSQVNKNDGRRVFISICATVPALGFIVADARPDNIPCSLNTELKVSDNIIENFKYIVTINKNGDIASIKDKTADGRELLSKPIRFELNKYKGDAEYPAWELTYREVMKSPQSYATAAPSDRRTGKPAVIVESGPARAVIKVSQKAGRSTFTYYLSLSCGDPCVNVYNEIEWREHKKILHNGFSLTVKSPKAVFDLGLGVIERAPATKKLYSVPAQKWADISDREQNFGIAILSDSKYGWIMKDDHTLRLTAIHSPKHSFRKDSAQNTLDFGLNRYSYAIYSHDGNFSNDVQFRARAFNQPMTAFIAEKHPGFLGDKYSFGTVSNKNVIIRAIKKAEYGDKIVVRVGEGAGGIVKDALLSLGNGIAAAEELYASEEQKGSARVCNGKLVFSLSPYEVKTFALTLHKSCNADLHPSLPLPLPLPLPLHLHNDASRIKTLELPYNADIITFNGEDSDCAIPGLGISIPAEIFPKEIECCLIKFKTSPVRPGNNALICAGQTLKVASDRLYIIAAHIAGDAGSKIYHFGINKSYPGESRPVTENVSLGIQSAAAPVACWDLYDLGLTAFIKSDRPAWICTHTHGKGGDNVASELYFFMYEINTENAREVTLPDDGSLIILAATEYSGAKRAEFASHSSFNRASLMYDSIDAERRKF